MLSALLPRTLIVGRRQQSESIEAAFDMEEGDLMKRFDTLVGAIACRVTELFVAMWIPIGMSSGLSPRCDPLTLVPLCDHKRDWHLIGLWLTCCVTVVSSVQSRTIR